MTKDTTFQTMGIAAMLPGMQHMLELMQHELDRMREMLAAAQTGELPRAVVKNLGYRVEQRRPVGRPPRTPEQARFKAKSGWDKLSPEERSAEMMRRIQVAREKREAARIAALHPRDVGHPDHEKWAANLRKTRKSEWEKKSPAQKKAFVAAMKAGKAKSERERKKAERAAATSPVVTMEKSA
jgi:hypothetical protein